jgi:hypothetical protein
MRFSFKPIVLISLTSVTLQAQSPIVRIAHFSDPYTQTTGPRQSFVRTIADINLLNSPTFPIDVAVVAGQISGDLIIDSPPRTVDQEFQNFRSQADLLEMPWKTAVGEHDLNFVTINGLFVGKTTKYTQNLGLPEYYDFDIAGVKFIVLNTYIMDGGGDPLGPTQYAWLQEKLAAASAASHVVILSGEHASGSGTGNYWSDQTAGNGTHEETMDLFESQKISMWLVGSSGESGSGASAVKERNYLRVRSEGLPAAARYMIIEIYPDRIVVMDRDADTNETLAVTTWPYNRAANSLSALPFTHAGPDTNTTMGNLVRLDGTMSRNLVTGTPTYTWSQLSGPETVQLRTGRRRAEGWFFAKTPGTYQFRLTGTQSSLTATDDVTVNVAGGPEPTRIKAWKEFPALYDIEVSGDTASDTALQNTGNSGRLDTHNPDLDAVPPRKGRESFIQFSVPTDSYDRAFVSVLGTNVNSTPWNIFSSNNIRVHSLTNDAWNESGMSWNGRPQGAGVLHGTLSMPEWTLSYSYPWADITSGLQAQTDGALTLRLKSEASGGQRRSVFSRNSTASGPSLILERSWPRIVTSKNLGVAEVGSPTLLKHNAQGGTGLTWSRVSGPGSASFVNDGTGSTRVTFTQVGSYTLAASVTISGELVTEQHVITVVLPGTDTDNDGLTDAWEHLYFESQLAVASVDTDGDGYSNALEQLLGLNPTVYDRPELRVLTEPNRVFRYSRSRAAGAPTAIPQVSENLISWQNITSTPRLVSQTAWSEVMEVDVPASSSGRQFCRVAAAP